MRLGSTRRERELRDRGRFSRDGERGALHVAMAGEAWRLGPADAARSYPDVERVIAAAKAAGADAVHPGYGFLSEKATDSSPRTPRAMKMELSVEALRAGVVAEVTVSEGEPDPRRHRVLGPARGSSPRSRYRKASRWPKARCSSPSRMPGRMRERAIRRSDPLV